jgi:hypothetical protein
VDVTSRQTRIRLASLAALLIAGAPLGAAAQVVNTPVTPTSRGRSFTPSQARTRIQVNPRPPLYRRCVGWYELQHRPSGTVLFPKKHCWWVRG